MAAGAGHAGPAPEASSSSVRVRQGERSRRPALGVDGAQRLRGSLGNRAVAGLLSAERRAAEALPRSTARALEPGARAEMERRFGEDMSSVRVHVDPAACDAVGAVAYTVGEHVVFNAGAYAPHRPAGRGLLAHELAHVIQQRRSTAAASQGRLEGEAARIGAAVARGGDGPAAVRERGRSSLARQTPEQLVAPEVKVNESVMGIGSITVDGVTILDYTRENATDLNLAVKATATGDGERIVNVAVWGPRTTTVIENTAGVAHLRELGYKVNIVDVRESKLTDDGGLIRLHPDPPPRRPPAKLPAAKPPQQKPPQPNSPEAKPAGKPLPPLPAPDPPFTAVPPAAPPPAAPPAPPASVPPALETAGPLHVVPPVDPSVPAPPVVAPGSATSPGGGSAPAAPAARSDSDLDARAQTIRDELDPGWLDFSWQSNIVDAFKDLSPADFRRLQDRLTDEEMTSVFDKLSAFEAVRIGTLGPVVKGNDKLNEERAAFIIDIRDWGSIRGVFYDWMFSSMLGGDIEDVLRRVGKERRLRDTILLVPGLADNLIRLGVDPSALKDQHTGILAGAGRGLADFWRWAWSSTIFSSGPGFESTYLPDEYQKRYVEALTGDFESSLTPGNIARGVASNVTLGMSDIPFAIYGAGAATVSAIGDVWDGNPEDAAQKFAPVLAVAAGVLLTHQASKLGTVAAAEDAALAKVSPVEVPPQSLPPAARFQLWADHGTLPGGLRRLTVRHLGSGELFDLTIDTAANRVNVTRLRTGEGVVWENGRFSTAPPLLSVDIPNLVDDVPGAGAGASAPIDSPVQPPPPAQAPPRAQALPPAQAPGTLVPPALSGPPLDRPPPRLPPGPAPPASLAPPAEANLLPPAAAAKQVPPAATPNLTPPAAAPTVAPPDPVREINRLRDETAAIDRRLGDARANRTWVDGEVARAEENLDAMLGKLAQRSPTYQHLAQLDVTDPADLAIVRAQVERWPANHPIRASLAQLDERVGNRPQRLAAAERAVTELEQARAKAQQEIGVYASQAKPFNGELLTPDLPEPRAGWNYVPTTIKGDTEAIRLSQVNGYRAELRLANDVQVNRGEIVIKYGDVIGRHGSDVISVNPTTGEVTLWDSKYLGSGDVHDPSPTFAGEPLKNAMEEARIEVTASDRLSPELRARALDNIRRGDVTIKTASSDATGIHDVITGTIRGGAPVP